MKILMNGKATFSKLFTFLVLITLGSNAWAVSKTGAAKFYDAQWLGSQDQDASLKHVVSVLNARSGYTLSPFDFEVFEDRDLANNHFTTYVQMRAGIPIQNRSIRVWTDLVSGDLLLLEARVAPVITNALPAAVLSADFTSELTMESITRQIAAHSTDSQMGATVWKDNWQDETPVRIVTVKGRRGKHSLTYSLLTRKLIEQSYEEFPQAAASNPAAEFALPALVYPIYEQVESTGNFMNRVQADLKYLNTEVPAATTDPFAALKKRRFLSSQLDPILGELPEGQAQGYWAMGMVKSQASAIRAGLAKRANDFSEGVILDGRFATVSLHPDAPTALGNLSFTPQNSTQLIPSWKFAQDVKQWEMTPTSSFLGRPLMYATEAMDRKAQRLPDHNPKAYLEDGFDEIQVYYAINQLFDSLRSMGFQDPELSTRPFNAFMYDPDISMKNNAYYTDDTINFTTYSPDAINFARDNSTIWHELGHGVMDRLMGELLVLADTGGLSEGMADFIAALVIADVTQNVPFEGSRDFRIINNTGFHLTNEVHDDGESYGGAMKDLLDLAIKKYGQSGVAMVSDITLESMRLCRNHPALNANVWFEHMILADSFARAPLRKGGELKDLIIAAISGRNFSLDGSSVADFDLKQNGRDLDGNVPGTRNKPMKVQFAQGTHEATYPLSVKLTQGANYGFKFPVTIKVEYRKGALQGGIHWIGEETGPETYLLNSEADTLNFNVRVTDKCDEVNQPDGSCKDYAYIQIWNDGETVKPQAKKRFYLSVKN